MMDLMANAGAAIIVIWLVCLVLWHGEAIANLLVYPFILFVLACVSAAIYRGVMWLLQ